MKYILPVAIVIGVGVVTLMSFFVDNVTLTLVRLALTDWVVILAGLALLVGVLNLLLVHMRKAQLGTKGWPYSLVVVVTTLGVMVVGLLEGPEATFEPVSVTQVIFNGVLVATQASLAGLMVFFLVSGATRMLGKRRELLSVVFLVSVLIVLLGWLPLPLVQSSLLPAIRHWVLQVPTTAGARGILMGVALGSMMVGLRVLTGVEWPYKK